MNKDQIKGRAEELSGKTKAAVGKVIKNDELTQKGQVEQVGGKARAVYGDAKNTVKKEWNKDADR